MFLRFSSRLPLQMEEKMGMLSVEDRAIVADLCENGVLLDAEGHRLDQTNGVMMITCSDGDQMPDIFKYQSGFCQTQRTDPRIHLFALNGGALLLPENSPINRATAKLISNEEDGHSSACTKPNQGMVSIHLQQDLVLLWNIQAARQLKDIHTIALYAHAPCGAATLCGLNMVQVLNYLIQAKARLRHTFPGLKVACFCHIDHGKDENGKPKKRSYFVPVEAAKRWLLAHPAP